MVLTSKVPFSTGTAGQCLCPGCPVQAKSACADGLKKSLGVSLGRNPLQREDIPGVYCSMDKATCSDIDPGQSCLCYGCPVFSQYSFGDAQRWRVEIANSLWRNLTDVAI